MFPIGTIIPYTGNLSKIPYGWHVCDGTNGTPDLRDRFLTGAGSSYGLGDTGGENYHTLTIDEMPKHNHSYILDSEGVSIGGNAVADAPGYANPFKGRYPDLPTTYTGGDKPHENRPPYYAVYYIMRVK